MKSLIASLSLVSLLCVGMTTYRPTAAPAPTAEADVYQSAEAHRHVRCQPQHWRAFVMQR